MRLKMLTWASILPLGLSFAAYGETIDGEQLRQIDDHGQVAQDVPSEVEDSEEASEEESETLRIVVTAEKRPDTVQDIPISITAFTQEDIEDADITSFEDIAGATPNFTAYTPGRNFLLYSVRGLSNFNFLSRDPVAFYIDDVPYDYTGFLDLDLTDLERVEVLRGPQSTLYGRNAEAGVVNVVPANPPIPQNIA
ncbi:MAG: Plug domain-containing protein [Cyanobacteria bacterium P01_D01_bin.56]